MLVGLFAIISPHFITLQVTTLKASLVGVFMLLLGLTLRLNHSGVQINSSAGLIRDYTAVFGFKKGQWLPLNDLTRLELTSKKVVSWNTPNGISPTFKSGVTTYTIGLFSVEAYPKYILQTISKLKADKSANTLSILLDLPLTVN